MDDFKRKRGEYKVKPLFSIYQLIKGWKGAYDLQTGDIELGTTERDTSPTIWHEFLHKYLFERESLESGIMWDNIAVKLEHFLFSKDTDYPYIFTVPSFKRASIIRGGVYKFQEKKKVKK